MVDEPRPPTSGPQPSGSRRTSDLGPRISDVNRICLWSGPRNVSTAVMYAFAQRGDTRVVDEPLYGHYLRVSGAQHPGREEVMATQNCNGDEVVRDVIFGPTDHPVLFIKQMAHHLVDLDLSFLAGTRNVLLIRDPAEMLPSLANQIPEPILRDTGLALQVDLYDRLRELGQAAPVIDARELLLSPEDILGRLCGSLGLAFDPGMLRWKTGGRPEDGVWARNWYQNVHRSSGFAPYQPKSDPVPERLRTLLDTCRPYYERLYSVALRGS